MFLGVRILGREIRKSTYTPSKRICDTNTPTSARLPASTHARNERKPRRLEVVTNHDGHDALQVDLGFGDKHALDFGEHFGGFQPVLG